MSEELKPCRNCGGKCDPTGWMCGDGRQGPECEGCVITTPDVESWNRLMSAELSAIKGGGEAVAEVSAETFSSDGTSEIITCNLPIGTKLYTRPPVVAEAVGLVIPDECPHMIMFDDAEREPIMFAGAGAREAALKTWEKVSGSWNAHLFVRIERNSRDDRYPSAAVAPPASGAVPVPRELLTVACSGGNEAWQALEEIRALLAKGVE